MLRQSYSPLLQMDINMKHPKKPVIFLASGGTGGHIFPAKSLGACLVKRGYEVVFVTDKRHHFIGKADNKKTHISYLSIKPLSGNLVTRLKGLGSLLQSLYEVYGLLKKYNPGLVVGFGGYPTVPVLLAAKWKQIPIIIHEQNSVLGKVNIKIAPYAAAIATAYEEVKYIADNVKTKVTMVGNPVRDEIKPYHRTTYKKRKKDEPLKLLVLGGSQGARILSEVVPQAIALLPGDVRKQIQVQQQCREADIKAVAQCYEKIGVKAEVAGFFDNVGERMTQSHLMISRAGASTLAELAVIGRPAILVPFALAADNHQYDNAKILAKGEGVLIAQEKDFTPAWLLATLKDILAEEIALDKMAKQVVKLGIIDADEKLADLAENVLKRQ